MFLTAPGHALADPDDDTTPTTSTSAPANSDEAPGAPRAYDPYATSSSPKPRAEDEGEAAPGDEDEKPDAPVRPSAPTSPSPAPAVPPPAPSPAPGAPGALPDPKPANPAQVKATACTFSREVTAQVAKDTKQFNELAAVENASWSDDELAAASESARAGYQTALDKIRSTVPTSGFPSDITAALTDLAHAADDWIYLIDNQNGDLIQGAISEYNDAVARLRTACQ